MHCFVNLVSNNAALRQMYRSQSLDASAGARDDGTYIGTTGHGENITPLLQAMLLTACGGIKIQGVNPVQNPSGHCLSHHLPYHLFLPSRPGPSSL